MSGAWPPPAPSVWKAHSVRPRVAAMVSSTKPLSLSVSLWMLTWVSVHLGHGQAVVDGRRRGAPVFMQLQADGAGRDLLAQRFELAGIALAQEAQVHREGVGRLQHAVDVFRARCAGGGKGAGGRAGAAAQHGGHAAGQRFFDLLRADEVDVAVDATGGDDHAFAGNDLGARADDDVHAGCTSGLPALPMAAMRQPLMPMSALTMPQWSMISALVMTRSALHAGPGR
jgi:hypothetical protein